MNNISIKGVSNYANDTAVTDYNTNKENANNLSNRVVLNMLTTIFEETTSLCCNNNMTYTTIACPCRNNCMFNQSFYFNTNYRNSF